MVGKKNTPEATPTEGDVNAPGPHQLRDEDRTNLAKVEKAAEALRRILAIQKGEDASEKNPK